jgi:hypothetical protein
MKRNLLLILCLVPMGCGPCAPTKKVVTVAEGMVKSVVRGPLPEDPEAARAALIKVVTETPAPVIIIALDGETLFDASGRSKRIFMEVLAEVQENALMRSIVERIDQGAELRDQAALVEAAGITDERLLELMSRRFKERFTSDSYIPDDLPRQGISQFFNKLYDAGATLAFIGDDDLVRSGPGWVQVLRNNGLPVLAPRAYLMLPPTPSSDLAAFRKDRLETIAGLGEVIAHFQVRASDRKALHQHFTKAYSIDLRPFGQPMAPGWAHFGTLRDTLNPDPDQLAPSEVVQTKLIKVDENGVVTEVLPSSPDDGSANGGK